MGLTPEERKQLEQLQQRASEPDEPEFEIEIWDGDRGARVPYSRGKKWLADTFGFDIGDVPAADAGDGGQAEDGGQDPQPGKSPTVRRFGAQRRAG